MELIKQSFLKKPLEVWINQEKNQTSEFLDQKILTSTNTEKEIFYDCISEKEKQINRNATQKLNNFKHSKSGVSWDETFKSK